MDQFDAFQFMREVKSNLAAGDGHQSYQEFLQTLKQYRKRNLDSSIVISTAQTLFRNHPNLLDGFKHFVSTHQSAAAAAAAAAKNSSVEFLNLVSLRSCIDFLNRVGARFNGGEAYCEFLECMCAYSRGKITPAAVYDKAVGLFGENDGDLVRELVRFLPESREGKESRKRKIDEADERGAKRRSPSSDRRAPAAARRGVDRDNEMEDLMCDDVRIKLLKSVESRAEKLYGGISGGSLSPASVRLDKRFSAVQLACIGRLGKKFLERVDDDLLHEMMMVLRKNKVALGRERVKIVQKWNRIRQTQ